MQIVYRAADGTEWKTEAECLNRERIIHKMHSVAVLLHKSNLYAPLCPDCTEEKGDVEDFYPIAEMILATWTDLKCEIDGHGKAFEERKKSESKKAKPENI